jgi:hypothetical protein
MTPAETALLPGGIPGVRGWGMEKPILTIPQTTPPSWVHEFQPRAPEPSRPCVIRSDLDLDPPTLGFRRPRQVYLQHAAVIGRLDPGRVNSRWQ